MTSRTLSKRLERLETRIRLSGEPWTMEIDFVSAVDGTITKRLQVTCGARLPWTVTGVPHA
jgi:hypothetical protein